ncbi:ribonuclease H-like domain-containing protein [Tanacetum coccineum]|uniref:Ribonuclease H-like domain-containing protein n=1 Tax=Tanacetum coccineum TaxID=301880 RepID=A0ABQ5B5Z1_9ASTR
MQFLIGLDDSYHPIRSALLTRDPLPDVKDAYNTISREESHREIHESSCVSDAKLNNNGNRGPNPNLNCKNYGKIRHTIERCYELVGFPPAFKKFANTAKQTFNVNMDVKNDKQYSVSPSSSCFTSEQMKKLLSLNNDSSSGNVHANMAGRPSFFNGNVWFNINFSKFFYANNKFCVKTISLGWIIDSGANQHLTVSIVRMFSVVDISSLNITVGHPNRTLATLIRDSKMFAGFDEKKCYIHDMTRQRTLGTGSESRGLYLFNMPPKCSLGESKIVMSFNVSKLLWHSRLGHPADQVLTTLHNELNISKSSSVSICEVCHRSDNETEFVNDKLNYMLSDLGIVHQTSYAHTLQQNRIAEKKYRHFLNVPRSLMFQGRIPLKFWSDCVLTVVYQINRLPSSVLNGRSQSLNDVGRTSSVEDGSNPLPRHRSTDTTNLYYGEVFATHFDDKSPSEGIQIDTGSSLTFYNDMIDQENDVQTPGVRERSNYCFATTLNKFVEPSSYVDDLSDNNWIKAMNNKIEALYINNTWTICDLRVGRNPIGCKWIFKIKYKASGEIERYKARLVAKAFSQRDGFDYDETFSPMIKMVIVRCLISIAVKLNWPLYQLYVNNAFLYGDLVKDVYMSMSQGYDCDDKLNKCLYGLKQAPMQWNAKLTIVLVEHGFVQSKFDYSLYVKSEGFVFVSLLVYVNDIVITGNDGSGINDFKQYLSTKFQIKDLRELKYFLGIEVLKNDKGICMSQRKYCLELFHEYGLLATKPVDTHFPENTVLSFKETKSDKFLKCFTSYQKLVGILIYLTNTRPDISYVVHCLSQHMHNPLQSHFKAALRVLRYLKKSPGICLQFNKTSYLKLKAYAGADWEICLKTRKSVTHFCIFLGQSLVSWKSKKQTTLSRSSDEAEYRSMASATCEIIWLGNLLHSLRIKVKVVDKAHDRSNGASKESVQVVDSKA